MMKVFTISQGKKVPDGMVVYPFLNPKDSTNDLPWDLLDVSIAAGDIAPDTASKIHVHPFVTLGRIRKPSDSEFAPHFAGSNGGSG